MQHTDIQSNHNRPDRSVATTECLRGQLVLLTEQKRMKRLLRSSCRHRIHAGSDRRIDSRTQLISAGAGPRILPKGGRRRVRRSPGPSSGAHVKKPTVWRLLRQRYGRAPKPIMKAHKPRQRTGMRRLTRLPCPEDSSRSQREWN